MKIRAYVHNKTTLIAEHAKKGVVLIPLKFQNGAMHILHQDGHQTRATPKQRDISPRQLRKLRHAERMAVKG